jgi:hypothetical protein
MRAFGVVIASPALDYDPRFLERVEDFAIEQFITQTSVKALDEAILPRAAKCDVCESRT